MMHYRAEKFCYANREEKAAFIARRFRDYLAGDILDVGGDLGQLGRHLAPAAVHRYVTLDCNPRSDLLVNLENGAIPLPDRAFATVVCCDVLEHLDHLHAVFGELVRVARQYLIISLPNNWFHSYDMIHRGRGVPRHYGLPAAPPQDRHKWYFNFDDANQFLDGQAARYRLRIVEKLALRRVPPWRRWQLPYHHFRRWFPATPHFRNRYFQNLWVVYARQQ